MSNSSYPKTEEEIQKFFAAAKDKNITQFGTFLDRILKTELGNLTNMLDNATRELHTVQASELNIFHMFEARVLAAGEDVKATTSALHLMFIELTEYRKSILAKTAKWQANKETLATQTAGSA